MKKLDKETLAEKFQQNNYSINDREIVEDCYKAGLEFAENHYLPKLKKLDAELALKVYEYGCLLEISEKYKENCENSNKENLILMKESTENMVLFEEENNKLINELKEYTELLKELSSALNKTLWQWKNPIEKGYELGNKIETFLNKK